LKNNQLINSTYYRKKLTTAIDFIETEVSLPQVTGGDDLNSVLISDTAIHTPNASYDRNGS
jgi:hypothetical protein